ncbi:glutamine amidotransferase [Gammaproteobacteria bacterium]|nr:glutamine amidotransferase [Gammaproteobacteria bacterium]
MTILVANYGMGNVGSIANMIRKVGGEAVVTGDANSVAAAEKLVLPGVGAFDQGMRSLAEKGLADPLREAAARGAPILGICLGMQLMLECSEEGQLPGLGLVPGDVRRFPSGDGLLRVPHMGWNRISIKKASPLFDGDDDDRRYYFVHSYYVSCRDPADVVATTVHGREFVSAFQRGNLFGVQFHPEKSHRFGMALFRRFLAI